MSFRALSMVNLLALILFVYYPEKLKETSKPLLGDPECFKLRSSGLWGYFVKIISGLMMKLLASCSAIYTGYHHEVSISKGKVSPNPSEF